MRSVFNDEPTSRDTSSLNIRSDIETPQPDHAAPRREPQIPILQTAEIEELLHELELFSLHNVTTTEPRDDPVVDESSDIDLNDMTTLLINL